MHCQNKRLIVILVSHYDDTPYQFGILLVQASIFPLSLSLSLSLSPLSCLGTYDEIKIW